MDDYKLRIQSVLERCIKVADHKNGQRFRFVDERTLETVYEAAFKVPSGYSIRHVRQQLKNISANCGAPIELDDRGGVVIVRVIKEDLPLFMPLVEEHLNIPDRLLIGYDRMRQPFYQPLHYRLLTGGASGAGKTDFLRFIVYQFIRQGYDIRIVDMKGFSFMPFDTVPNIKVSRNLPEAVVMLRDAYFDLLKREKMVIDNRHRNIIDRLQPICVIIDEAAQIAPKQNSGDDRKIAKMCDEYCAKISQKGREPRVQLIYCTQRPDAEIINPQVKANVEAAVAFRTKTRTNSEIILDRGGAEDISPDTPGRCIYSGSKDVMLQVPYIGGDDAWNRLLIPYKTEVLHAGSSQRKPNKNAHYITVGENATSRKSIQGQRESPKESISRIKAIGARKTYRGNAQGRHDQSVETNQAGETGDTSQVDSLFFDESRPLFSDW